MVPSPKACVVAHIVALPLPLSLSLCVCVSVLETHSHKHTNIESRRLPYHPLSHLILLAIASNCRSKNTHMSAERPNSRTLLSQGNHRERERERENEGKDQWFYFSLVSINHSTTISLMENPN